MEDCRSLRYFLQGFGIRVFSRRPRFLAFLRCYGRWLAA